MALTPNDILALTVYGGLFLIAFVLLGIGLYQRTDHWRYRRMRWRRERREADGKKRARRRAMHDDRLSAW